MRKKDALRQLIIFSAPIIFGHLGIMLTGTGDMIIAGRYSTECLAAIGLAISIANPIMISLLGLEFAISPILAQKRGKGEKVEHYFWTIILYSFFVAIISMGLTLLSLYLVPILNYGENINRLITEYLYITSFSTFGLCLYQGLKEFFQAQEKTFAANTMAMAAAGVNLFLNFAFVFGRFGMPQLFEAGLAWASLGVRCFMAIGLFLLAYKFWTSSKKIHWDFMKEVFKLGMPISVSLFFEILAFCAVTLFIGKFAEIQTAANNIALNIGSLAFMVPMSISAAVGVKVGHAYGEKRIDKISVFNKMSLLLSFMMTVLMGLSFYFIPDQILSLYTSDPEIHLWGKRLLFWVACFQIFDGAQATLAGILRGLGVTRATSIAIFIGYWLIGIPLGYYLGFYTDAQAQGFWIGLTISLAAVALMLSFILNHKMIQLKLHGIPSGASRG